VKNEEIIKKLNESIELFNAKKVDRFARYPFLFIKWKFLEMVSLVLKHPIKIGKKLFWGDNMKIVFPEFISMNIFKYGYYEEGLTKMFLEYLKPNMVFLDIGAHFGYYSLLGSLLVGELGRVHAFEPTTSSFNILKENTLGKSNVKINKLCVSNENKKIDFYDYGVQCSAFNSLYDPRMQKPRKYKKHIINCVSIDDYILMENIAPNFIKIDAESSEYDIIIGMEKTIIIYKPIITLEVGDNDIKGIHKNRDILSILINKYGYQAYEYINDKIIRQNNLREKYTYNNILFYPNDMP
jgi:FkbM family methyltransferase